MIRRTVHNNLRVTRCQRIFYNLLAFTGLSAWVLSVQAAEQTPVQRGEYVTRAAGCIACHTDIENDGEYLAGGRAFSTPFGTFFSPNITSDRIHGIGAWSLVDLTGALRHGEGPGGKHYYPVFPYTAYSGMRPDDIEVLNAYLHSVTPVALPNREHDLPWYLQFRLINYVWKLLFFEPKHVPADLTDPIARGAYLVNNLGHCTECHTSRDQFGVLDETMTLAGTRDGPDGEIVPNITPHKETGIGRWSKRTLLRYFRRGMEPGGDFAGGLMVDVIDESLRHLDNTDLEAIVAYLKSIEPIEHSLKAP